MKRLVFLILCACGPDLGDADAGVPPCPVEVYGKACTDPCGRFSSPAACRAWKDGGR